MIPSLSALLPLPHSINAADGTALHLVEWSAAGARGTVLIVHGLGDHGDRYAHVAQWLSTCGFRVISYDQRGHGRSQGARGVSPSPDTLYEDLALVIDSTRDPHRKLILLGHSMGGVIAGRFVAEQRRPVDGLMLSSPALAANLSVMQRIQLYIGERMLPSLAQGNGVNPRMISHDQTVVRAYMEDPLVHNRISARLARVILDAGDAVRAHAVHWTVPTLLVYAGADALVAPRGSDAFAATAPRGIVESTRFDGLYHEILNETEALAAPVFARIAQWLDARFPV